MDIEICKKAGLNESQAKVYLHLVSSGEDTPPNIATVVNESRTNTYNVLDQLAGMGLVESVDGPKSMFRAKNPIMLKQLINQRSQELQRDAKEVSSFMPELVSKFRLTHNMPGVFQIEGKEAFRSVYNDIISHRDEVLVIASINDRKDPEVAKVIDEQIDRQVQAGLSAKVLAGKGELMQADNDTLQLKNIIVKATLNNRLPAQVLVYGDNVAFSTFNNGVSTTVITNQEIAETMKIIFDEIWIADERGA